LEATLGAISGARLASGQDHRGNPMSAGAGAAARPQGLAPSPVVQSTPSSTDPSWMMPEYR
jgi:hypothetical protein